MTNMRSNDRSWLTLGTALCLAAISLATSPANAQNSRATDVTNYQGADREQRLVDGAKREGSLTLYSNAPTETIRRWLAALRKNTASRSIFTAPAPRKSASVPSMRHGRGVSTSTSFSTTRPPWRR